VLLFLHKIRANTVRKWLTLRHSHYCRSSPQRSRMQDCLGHSQPPDVNADQIQITCYANCWILLGSVRIEFSLKWGCHLNTIKATLKYWQKSLSFFKCLWPTHKSKPEKKWSTLSYSFQLWSRSWYKIFFSGAHCLIWSGDNWRPVKIYLIWFHGYDFVVGFVMHVPPLGFWRQRYLGNHIIWFICSPPLISHLYLPQSFPCHYIMSQSTFHGCFSETEKVFQIFELSS